MPDPKRVDSLPVQYITRGFCIALMAIYNYVVQQNTYLRTNNPSDQPTALQKTRASVAQSYFFKLGLDPSPRATIDVTEKQALAALVEKLEQSRRIWRTEYDRSSNTGSDELTSIGNADKLVPKNADLAKDLLTGNSKTGVDIIKDAFRLSDSSGKETPLTLTVSAKAVFRPATTNIEKCETLTQIRDLMIKDVQLDIQESAKALGVKESEYQRVEFLVEPGTTFEEYEKSYRAMLNNEAPATKAIYEFAQPSGPGGQPAPGESNIYGRWEPRIDADPATLPHPENAYEAVSGALE